VEIVDDSSAQGSKYFNRIRLENYTDFNGFEETWLMGDVLTPYGIVSVYSQGGEQDRFSKYTRLEIVVNGRYLTRVFNKRYTSRGLVTKVRQWIADLIEEGTLSDVSHA
tara:strand:+ start:266 stop:592 length:327 start_codon:yes stop_codon:yes gene_type:complete